MKFTIDTKRGTVLLDDGNIYPLYSKESLERLSELWVKVQWNELNWQSLSWMGMPIWQLAEDMIRLQEVICQLQPDVIIETGTNEGGSAIFFASLCKLLDHGRVISIDVSIPEHVRNEVSKHSLGSLVTLIEGDSVSPETLRKVSDLIGDEERVMVFLDSAHTKAHVLSELKMYEQFVKPGSYIVATDGVMETLYDTPNGDPLWEKDNPASAARDFQKENNNFVIERPKALFNEDKVVNSLTYWPDAWLKRTA